MIILISLVSFYSFNVATRKLKIDSVAHICGFKCISVGLDCIATHRLYRIHQ